MVAKATAEAERERQAAQRERERATKLDEEVQRLQQQLAGVDAKVNN